jgi:Cu(I)/Ag(I) efflux system membrane fusion protein
MGLIKEGLLIEAESTGYPGEIFKGEISSIANVVDPMTRSIVARATVDNSRHLLKPEMFVNVVIRVDLGELLSVSEESIIHTGPRNLVVVQTQANHFATKEVKLGHQADGYFEVLSGLLDGETVITSGNFLIDSESRLQSALSQTQ